MKFIRFYLLTFVITRDNRVEAAVEFSQEDLQFISDRLYPAECTQLLSYFSKARETLKASLTQHHNFRDDWVTENSRVQCLESLIEHNEKGKKGGFTKTWLERSLHKLGRADLVSRLKKRWKKNTKTRRKNTNRKSKVPRSGRSEERESHGKSRKKIVTSHRRDTIKNGKKNEDDFGQRFIIFLFAGCLLVVFFVGCTMIVSYRRACRCYKNYLKDYDFKEQKRSFDRQFNINETQRLINSQDQDFQKHKEEYTKLVDDSDKMETSIWSENLASSQNIRKNESFDTAVESEEEKCTCSPKEENYKRNISPCARIKRFFDSPKRLLRGTDEERKGKNKLPEINKRRNACRENSVTKKLINREVAKKSKHDRKKSRKSTGLKRANRERKAKTISSNCKTAKGQKPVGCTCEMCKLFNITSEAKCSEKTKMIRRRNS